MNMLFVQIGVVMLSLLVAVAAIVFEESGRRIGRLRYFGVILAIIVAITVFSLIAGLVVGIVGAVAAMDEQNAHAISTIVGYAAGLVGVWIGEQAVVRRARDIGWGKGVCYLAVVPVVGFVIGLLLLFMPGKAGEPQRLSIAGMRV